MSKNSTINGVKIGLAILIRFEKQTRKRKVR